MDIVWFCVLALVSLVSTTAGYFISHGGDPSLRIMAAAPESPLSKHFGVKGNPNTVYARKGVRFYLFSAIFAGVAASHLPLALKPAIMVAGLVMLAGLVLARIIFGRKNRLFPDLETAIDEKLKENRFGGQ